MREMYTYSPRFLNRTFFVEPFVLTPPIRRRGNRHRVVLDTQRLVLTVRSEERTVRVLTWEDVFYRLRERKIGFKFEDIWKSKENREYRPEFHDVLEAIDKDTRDFILKGGYRQSYRALCIPSQ